MNPPNQLLIDSWRRIESTAPPGELEKLLTRSQWRRIVCERRRFGLDAHIRRIGKRLIADVPAIVHIVLTEDRFGGAP